MELLNGGVTKLKEQLKKLEAGGVLFLDEAYQLNPKTNPMGAQVGRDHQRHIHVAQRRAMGGWAKLIILCVVAWRGCIRFRFTLAQYRPPQVLDYLLPEMENRRGKLVVVLAGYAKPMEELMGHNEGLPSRFAQVGCTGYGTKRHETVSGARACTE